MESEICSMYEVMLENTIKSTSCTEASIYSIFLLYFLQDFQTVPIYLFKYTFFCKKNTVS